MYIQYETKEGEYYCLDLLEKPLNMLLFSYSWMKPMKLYKTDKKYTLDISEEEKERRNRIFPFIVPFGYVISKFINFDLKISFRVNYIVHILLYIVIYLISVMIIYCIFKWKRKKVEKKIVINKKESVIIYFYPKTKFRKIFLVLFYPLLITYTTIFCFNLLRNPTVNGIILSIFLLGLIVELAFYHSLLLCEPHIHGEILKRITPKKFL